MNRIEIKEEAKAKIKGNIWNLLWPALVIMVLSSAISSLFGGGVTVNVNDLESAARISPMGTAGSLLSSVLTGFLSAGYLMYVLTFIRTGKFVTENIINTIKEKWLNILIADILVAIIVFACTLLFIVPGIIMGLAYTMVTYLVINTDVAGNDALGQSREMMKGYKWDYFVFLLSFVGWAILCIFTLGILLIWLYPYFTVANAMYYEKLYEKTKKTK